MDNITDLVSRKPKTMGYDYDIYGVSEDNKTKVLIYTANDKDTAEMVHNLLSDLVGYKMLVVPNSTTPIMKIQTDFNPS